MKVDRESAEVWAGWFRCLGDPSRVLILNRLALSRTAMTVGELVETLDIGQPTVSHHLKVLAETGFVLVERRGTSSYFRVNERCLECFPSAAEVVMGRLPRYRARQRVELVPWLEATQRRRQPRAKPAAR